jgi:hypothetical protein
MAALPAALDGLRDSNNCLILSNDPPMQLIAQVQQPAGLILHQLGQGDA